MRFRQVKSLFLLVFFVFLNTMLTLSWTKSWTSTMFYEEIRELAGADETNDLQSVNIDFIFSDDTNLPEDALISKLKQSFAQLTTAPFNSYIKETYSPPEI